MDINLGPSRLQLFTLNPQIRVNPRNPWLKPPPVPNYRANSSAATSVTVRLCALAA
jgi:hypothetical protein